MREAVLRFEPFDILSIHNVKGSQEVNEHGVISFSGVISSEKEMEYLSMSFKPTWVKAFTVKFDGSEEIWFDGILSELEIESGDDVILHVTAKTGSSLMDVSLHTRSYQEPSTTYDDILSSYTDDYPKSKFIMKKGNGEVIDSLIMQYTETDWGFTRRLASHFNSVLIPDFKAGGVNYYFGAKSSGPVSTISTDIYKVINNVEEYQEKSKAGVELSALDAVCYVYRCRDVYSLGDGLAFNGKTLYISRISTAFDGDQLYHTYYLRTQEGLQVQKDCNLCSIGVSFYAKILEVERDRVKVSINEDENKGGCGTRWFAYSTVYSTPDGTGWYAMPEIGDDVRLYIPCENEGDGYVISATHLESSESDERVNPDYKSIMNKYKKEVLFTPDSLIITNNNGMSIQLLDEEGIRIVSDKTIELMSEESINIVSTQDTVTILAPDSILLQQSDVVTHLKENIAFGGAQVHID